MATLSVKIDPRGAVQGGDVAEKALKDVQNQAARTEASMTSMSQNTARGAGLASNKLKGLAQQGSQVVDMGLATGQWGKAFFLQMSDIAMVLGGPLTIAAGAAIGVLGTIGLSFLKGGDDAEDFGDSLDSLGAKMEAYANQLEAVGQGSADLFGEALGNIQRVSEASADLVNIYRSELLQAVAATNDELAQSVLGASLLQGKVADVGDVFNIDTLLRGNITLWKENREHAGELVAMLQQLGAGGPLQEQYDAAVALREEFKLHVDVQGEMTAAQSEFFKNLSVSIERMEALGAVSGDVGTEIDSAAANQARMNDIMARQYGLYADTRQEANKLAYEIGQAEANALALAGIDITGPISSASLEAAKLAANLGISLNEALSLQNLRSDQVYSGRGGDPRQFENDDYTSELGYKSVDELIKDLTPRTAGGGGGGVNEAQREAERIADAYDDLVDSLNPAIAATREFEANQAKVNAALKSGHIDVDAASATVDQLTRTYEASQNGMAQFAETGGSVIDGLIDGTLSLKDALAQMIIELVKAKAAAAALAASGGATSSIGTALIGGFAGLFDSGGTIPTGQTGIVGENGPEIVTATSQGSVVTSRVDTARQLNSQQAMAASIQVGVTVDDDGKIQAYVRDASIQAANAGRAGAVQDVKNSLRGWNESLNTYGALA